MRFLIPCLCAPVITFGLLLFMASLINQSAEQHHEKQENPYFELFVNNTDESFESRKRTKPEPPKPEQPQEIQPTELVQTQISNPDMSVDLEVPSLDLSSNVSAMSISMPGIESMDIPVAGAPTNTTAMPLYRVQPRYPRKAARLGKEGYVVLSFDINEAGRVMNVNVLDANPRRLFEREAERALKQWKYKPMLVNGEAVSQLGQTIRLDFQMEK
ncbi:protein TonB [Psychromonas marina]|uniref:Protein TonB n=1 Tax=Psychromonas marina TaxID=88364 RepID=A0ABQ6E1C6_9GAMM|nr:energy transducer TonB [Psychromonas marina]GLS90990.1 protein TonB [Psychromonas marina]